MTPKPSSALIVGMQSYLTQYVTFSQVFAHSFVAALWAIATHLHLQFDAFPYVVITSHTKRSGKTRLAELLSFMCARPVNITGVTAAAVFRSIRDEHPTLIIDEAETLGRESSDTMRAVMNSGYRRGQTVRRASGPEAVTDWPTYCPKVFVLIGDVQDTLRDRAIVVQMQRAEPSRRFLFDTASQEGAALRGAIVDLLTLGGKTESETARAITLAYHAHGGLSFLSDRDEEIWLPLFAICQVLAPERVAELTRVAVDLATEKTAAARRYVNLLGEEEKAQDDEYARRLVRDLVTVVDGRKAIFTADALAALKALDTAPWRKFRGEGLTAIDMGNLLARFGIAPTTVRFGGRKAKNVAKGYKRADLQRALAKLSA